MKGRPSWAFWTGWAIAYTVLNLIILAAMHGGLTWKQVPSAVEDAALGATLTWFFALWRWYKVQDRF